MTPRHDALLDPVSGVHDLIDGYRRTQTVCAAARIGIPDLLAGGPLILDEIAAECGVPADETERLMRALVGLDVCTVGPEGYRTTALGRALESTDPGGAHARAIMTADLLYPLWSDLTDRLCGGVGSSTDVPDVPGDPARTDDELRRIASVCPVPARSVLVEVGGGGDGGAVLAEILRTHPDCRTRPWSGGTDPAGDVYLLSGVLHRCDDERAAAVLSTVRAAMGPSARLLVVERLVSDDEGADAARAGLDDLNLLLTTGGRERTEVEFSALLASAGLAHVGTASAGGRLAVVEAAHP